MASDKEKGTEGVKGGPTPGDFAKEQIQGLTGEVTGTEKVVAASDDLASVLKRCQDLGLTVSIGTGKQLVLNAEEEEDLPPLEPIKDERRFKIRIDEQDNTDNNADVFVSCNGMPYLIKRGFDVVVPESIVGVIRDAVITIEKKDPTTGEVISRNIPRFAMRILGEVKEEVAEEVAG